MIISGILTLIFLVIFLASYLTDSRRIINGYIAIVVMQRKRHTIIVGTILGFSVLLTIFSFLFL